MNENVRPVDEDKEPQINNDPQSQPEEGVHKTIIAPDPKKVAEADRTRKKDGEFGSSAEKTARL